MSRLGKKPIVVPEKIKVEFKNGVLEVSGANGKLSQVINKKINQQEQTIIKRRRPATTYNTAEKSNK